MNHCMKYYKIFILLMVSSFLSGCHCSQQKQFNLRGYDNNVKHIYLKSNRDYAVISERPSLSSLWDTTINMYSYVYPSELLYRYSNDTLFVVFFSDDDYVVGPTINANICYIYERIYSRTKHYLSNGYIEFPHRP